MKGKQKEIKDFEFMINKAQANAYSKISLERQLTKGEFKKFNLAVRKLYN